MPIENLNLQILIPKVNEVETYHNALKNINENIKASEVISITYNMDNSFKKVHSDGNVARNDMLINNSANGKKEKYKYQRKNTSNALKHAEDDDIFNGIGANINIKV